MSGGVGAADGRGRDERGRGVRALIEFGRKKLLYSLILSRLCCDSEDFAFAKAGRPCVWRVSLPACVRQEVKENVALIGEKPGAQPPKRHYNTVLNNVNIILPR
jgi:hypothetical protein